MVDGDRSTYGSIYFNFRDDPAKRIKLKINKLLNLSSITMYGDNYRSLKGVEIYAEDTYCGTCGRSDPCYVRCNYVKADKIYLTNLQLSEYQVSSSIRIYEIKFYGKELPRGLTDLAKVGIAVGACCFLALFSLCTVRHFERRGRGKVPNHRFHEHHSERYAIDRPGKWLKHHFFEDLYRKYLRARVSWQRSGQLEVDYIYLRNSIKWTIEINHAVGQSISRVEFQVIRIENSSRGNKTIVRFKEIDEDGQRVFLISRINICQEFRRARVASSIEDSERGEARQDSRRREENGQENRRGEEVGQEEEASRQETNTTSEEQTLRPSAPQMMDLAPPSYETYRNSNTMQPHEDIPSYEEVMANARMLQNLKSTLKLV